MSRTFYFKNTRKIPFGVYQVDVATNVVIQKFPSAEVAKNRTDVAVSSIYSCINGSRKTAGGFRWLKENKNNNNVKVHN